MNWVLFTAMAGLTWVLLVRSYYHLKPLIPVWLRLTLRRFQARRQLRSSPDSWPILDSAGVTPAGWPGWPDDLAFAFVLTHDVETQMGVDRVRQLAEIEMALGFRSCFNFIPEGPYQVPDDLIQWLTERGFEIGVHDHRHDGKLYHSRERFSASARRINHFLKKWNSVGFRSAFMLRNLQWLHALDIHYDCSTFDTDPFEPQPEGANTIFPFWVPGCDGGGYVELPYTLAQDSTLFVILRERSPDIWKQKLRWIASRGGMAMINVHPDFIAFEGARPDQCQFPAALYEEFLLGVSLNYQGQYWSALPKEVAAFYRDHLLANTTQVAGESPRRLSTIQHISMDRAGQQVANG
ncbi:MAG: hypothetical protein H7X97_00925 [Opitutaceae bacterium]|nr:hypothetical protein [Verrucomicrobiales bacterium]